MELTSDSWKTNLAAGAQPAPARIGDEEVRTCLQAARALGADYCGVDLLRSDTGELFVLEVNSMPAWQGLQRVTDFNIASRIADFCQCKLGENRNNR